MQNHINLPSWFDLVFLDTVGSTNDELKRRAVNEAAPEGTVVWASKQTAGKGREKRHWVSKRGNMYVSVLFRPNCFLRNAAQLGFFPVIAAFETLEHMIKKSKTLSYKWPNDLLLNSKKVGGTLLEAGTKRKTITEWVVVGFGLNLEHSPDNVRFPATSIKDELDEDIEIKEIVQLYLRNLANLYVNWQEEGFKPIRKSWLASAYGLNKPLSIMIGTSRISGLFRDLDEDGTLIVETGDGLRRIAAGDVYFTHENGER